MSCLCVSDSDDITFLVFETLRGGVEPGIAFYVWGEGVGGPSVDLCGIFTVYKNWDGCHGGGGKPDLYNAPSGALGNLTQVQVL